MTVAPGDGLRNGCAGEVTMCGRRASFYPDPGDAALLRLAAEERRIMVTIDTDFGALVYLAGATHAGIIRLPDVPAAARIR